MDGNTTTPNDGDQFYEPTTPLADLLRVSPPPPLFPLTSDYMEVSPMPDVPMTLLAPATNQQPIPAVPPLNILQQPTLVLGEALPRARRRQLNPRSRIRRNPNDPAPYQVMTRVKVEEALTCDNWGWRKYGEKEIKGSPYPRSYYRCSKDKECPARKLVEKEMENPEFMKVTYIMEHDHQMPGRRNCLSGTTRARKKKIKKGCWSSGTLRDLSPLSAYLSLLQMPEEPLSVEDMEIVREGEIVFVGQGDDDGASASANGDININYQGEASGWDDHQNDDDDDDDDAPGGLGMIGGGVCNCGVSY